MSYRETLVSVTWLLSALAVPVAARAQEKALTPAADLTDARTVRSLADGWRFKQDNALRGAETPGFDDAGWQQISVPHTWNRVGHYIPDPQTHLNTAQSINKTQGVGWYRLTFTPGAEFRHKRVWLE